MVEHDITGVRGVEGSTVTVTCGMGWPHRDLTPTFPVTYTRGWGCPCVYNEETWASISPLAVRGLEHNHLPVP